uniref:KNR4/SMI1 homolog n=1 Tax=Nicotiana tabacum TaxID=4097 RepID=A0A1S4AU35_TOBAC|nr:PREDICTED: KNR4/SMI1 homolog [Nicotiana tabacum]
MGDLGSQNFRALELDRPYEGDDPFCGLFTGVEDAADSNDASDLFHGVQQALNQAVAAHREACSRSRVELRRYEVDLQRVTEERNALKLLLGKKREEIKDLCAKLIKAHQDQTDLSEQEKGLIQAWKTEELEARLASELAKAEKTKADADAFVAIYRADAEAAQSHAREVSDTARTRAHWISEFAKCQYRRETLEEIHARGFDLSKEITKARELEAGSLASDDDGDDDDDDDDDNDRSKSGSQSGEEPDGEKTAPVDN